MSNENNTAKDFIEAFNELVFKDITYNTLEGRMNFDAYTNSLNDITQLVLMVNSVYYALEEDKKSSMSANTFINTMISAINSRIEDGDKIMIALKADIAFKSYAEHTCMWTDETQRGE